MINKNDIYKNINDGILEERYWAFRRNLAKNLDLIRRYGGLAGIIPRLKGKNVIIAGAGPSLDRELDLLKRYQFRDEIIIVATDMALAPLSARGIRPAYVISCETTPVDYFSSISTADMHLLAFSCMSSSNIRKWKGDISFYNWMTNNAGYDELWKEAGDLGSVATGSIVTTQAVSLALGCGIRSLMIAGNDMAFGTEYYAKETVVHRKNVSLSSRCRPMETIEFNAIWRRREYRIERRGRSYYTSSQFLAAKLWLEELFKGADLPIYDNSEPGCSETSVRKSGLKEYLNGFDRYSRNKRR
ncbi:MAG: DUF115 domain-containing protein [Spirochaetes bacterium]|nr:DUF115 domain-containing protein [Spirochaetota bacterium]